VSTYFIEDHSMPVEHEKLWEYDAVVIGQAGMMTHVPITVDNIRAYALAAQHHHTRYVEPEKYTDYTQAVVAMPSMVLAYAPLLRYDIASNNGWVALEESKTARRQTPFAKCEIRWFQPVVAGDTITACRRVLDKYERRGSKFVTFRVEAANQRGDKAAEYDYTCIFEYAKGRQEVPPAPHASEPEPLAVRPGHAVAEAARRLTFDDVSIGDVLPGLRVTETQETINRYNDVRLAGKPSSSNIHTDEAFARQNIFGGAVNAGPATMSYVDQVLESSFPLRSFYNGGSLLMWAIEPFRAGDVVTMQAEVTGKRRKGRHRLVTCRIRGLNQRGALVCLSDAILNLPG
jgi:acyl dehydratase